MLAARVEKFRHEASRAFSDVFFDPDKDPIFAQGVPMTNGYAFLSFLGQVFKGPAMAPLRQIPFLVYLAIKTLIYLVIILLGLAVGAWVFPAPSEAGVWTLDKCT